MARSNASPSFADGRGEQCQVFIQANHTNSKDHLPAVPCYLGRGDEIRVHAPANAQLDEPHIITKKCTYTGDRISKHTILGAKKNLFQV